MELVALEKGRNLFAKGQVPSHVYYPVGALISMMIDMPDGFSVETYMMGKAGALGLWRWMVPAVIAPVSVMRAWPTGSRCPCSKGCCSIAPFMPKGLPRPCAA